MALLWTLLLPALLGVLAYHRLRARTWAAALGLHGAGAAALGLPALAGLAWALAAAAALAAWPAARRRLLAAPLLPLLRRALPPLSETEREALEAGDTDWESAFFTGRPDFHALLARGAPALSPRERAFLEGPVRELCEALDDWRITHHDQDLSPAAWDLIRRHRLFGMIIPEAYGGHGFSALAHGAVVMRLASRSIAGAVTVMVPNSLGPAELLLRYGSEAQRREHLPRLARGEAVPCFALTGPTAGSDAASIPDRGVVCRGSWRGREVLGVRLSWNKRYITLAPVATLLGVAFRLDDPEGLLGPPGERGITLALVPADTPGVETGRRHLPLNCPFQNGPTTGRDVFVPLEALVGGAEGAGQGWRMLMECLAAGRAISLPSLAAGATQLAAFVAGAYARLRRQFHRPIGRFEGVAEPLARIAGHAYAVEAGRRLAAQALDRGARPAVASALLKHQATERMRRAVNDAMDVLGGRGICLGPRNELGRVYQAVPIAITVEGANILTRSLIVYGQGLARCHPYVLQELEAAREADPGRAVARLDAALAGHAAQVLGNAARALWLGLSGGLGARVPGRGAERRLWQRLARLSAAFALAGDGALLLLGGRLKRHEAVTGRLADVLGELYLASAALKRFHDEGRPAEDLPLLRWACEDACHRAEERLAELLRNLPRAAGSWARAAVWLLRLLIFPRGRLHAPPDDALVRACADAILRAGPARERLTGGIHVPHDSAQPLGRLARALELAERAEPVEGRLRRARREGALPPLEDEALWRAAAQRGLLTEEEAALLGELEALRAELIQVDAFTPDFRALAPGPPAAGEGASREGTS